MNSVWKAGQHLLAKATYCRVPLCSSAQSSRVSSYWASRGRMPIYDKGIKGRYDCRLNETFMGFHCGNTSCSLLKNPHMGYQLIAQSSRVSSYWASRGRMPP